MNQRTNIILASLPLFLALVVVGCFSPQRTADKNLDAVAKAKAAENANRERQGTKASALIHGTGLALAKAPATNTGVRVAYELNSRAQVVAGPPDYADAVAMADIVDGATSGDLKSEAEARRKLDVLDRQIAGLQETLARLETRTERAEENRDGTLRSFAAEVSTWRGIKRVLWFGGFGVAVILLGPLLLGALGTMFPVFGPIAGIGSKILGGLGRSVMRIVPSVATEAGVVPRGDYERATAAASDLSAAIAELKAKNRAAFEGSVAPVLRNAALARAGTESDTAEVIARLRARNRSPVT